MSSCCSIPRVLHQLWIGPRPAPADCIDSWRRLHGEAQGFRFQLWDEEEISTHGLEAEASRHGVLGHLRAAPSLAGQADILRWLILARDGGVFVDADSECLRSVGELLDAAEEERSRKPAGSPRCITAYENEARRGPGAFPGLADIPDGVPLLANGFLAFPPNHPVALEALREIAGQQVAAFAARAPWRASGPGLLTRVVVRLGGPERCGMTVLPSYAMYPVHCTGLAYEGHGRVYAHQLWSSTREGEGEPEQDGPGAGSSRAEEDVSDGAAKSADLLPLPRPAPDSPPPETAVSVLACSRNTRAAHLRACLDSLLHQTGRFRMQLVWVDDGSDPLHAAILARMLDDLERRSRWCEVTRLTVGGGGQGVAAALQLGLGEAKHELVARMDSDDVMVLDRLAKQLAWMDRHPEVVCVGTQVALFRDGQELPHEQTFHPAVLRRRELAAYAPRHLPRWFANHPTLMFRRGPVLAAGGYRTEFEGVEDYDLLLRLVATYGEVHNMDEVLLYYRVHPGQVTFAKSPERAEKQDALAAEFVRQVRQAQENAAQQASTQQQPQQEPETAGSCVVA